MTAKLYKNLSDEKVLNKNIEEIKQVNVTLKSNTDIINPTIDVLYTPELLDVNYIYLDNFNRYYYATVDTILGNRITYKLKVDVLMSFSIEILKLSGTIDRNENKSNGYLQDSNYKAYSYTQKIIKTFPVGLVNDNLILMTVG